MSSIVHAANQLSAAVRRFQKKLEGVDILSGKRLAKPTTPATTPLILLNFDGWGCETNRIGLSEGFQEWSRVLTLSDGEHRVTLRVELLPDGVTFE